MTTKVGWRVPAALLALAGLVVALLYAPTADTAPGDFADLSVTKSDSPDPVLAGDLLTYSVEVANLGPEGATEVIVVDRLPNHAAYVSATPSKGNCERKGRQVRCEIGSLAVDPSNADQATVTIQVRPRRPGTIENGVSVDSVEIDPIEINDRAEASTTVQARPRTSTCRGVTTTLTGTEGSDRLLGTEGDDVVAGLGGGDEILGLGGADLICSGGGRDRVTAGLGADRVFGGRGGDLLFGGRGSDLLAGNPGADVLAGNRGRDRLRGGFGFDHCMDGAGFDRERGCER